jgi:hypothetical protein
VSRLRSLLAIVVLVAGVSSITACEPTLLQETGLVTAIRQPSLTTVEGFDLLTGDGRTVRFSTLDTRFDAVFPVQHIGEHMALAQPITVTYKVVDGRNEVVKLADAEPSP